MTLCYANKTYAPCGAFVSVSSFDFDIVFSDR